MQVDLLLRNVSAAVLASLKRFPETILLVVAFAAIAIYSIHFNPHEDLRRILLVITLGCPVFLCVRALFERMTITNKKQKTLIFMIAAIGLLAYYFSFKDFDNVLISRYIMLSVFFYLTFTVIPYFYRKENYELYVINLFTHLSVTFIYSLIVYAGLFAMLYTLKILFLMDISQKLFMDLAYLTIVFAWVFFLAGVPGPQQKIQLENYPKVLKVLFIYIIMPLLTAYSAILYIYFCKILITMQWPDKIVANLVLWYSIVSALVIFSIYPLHDSKPWVNKFITYFPKIILPLMVMMFISMGIRINAYGITESRYFVLLAGIVISGYMLYLGFIKNPRNIVITISIAMLAILSVWGPWNCFTVSKLSQNLRFEKILKRYDMIHNNVVTKSALSLSYTDKEEIKSIIVYFDRNHKLEDLQYLPRGFTIKQMKDVFGFGLKDTGKEYFRHTLKNGEMLQLSGLKDFDYVAANVDMYSRTKASDIDGDCTYYIDNSELHILKKAKVIYTRNIQDVAMQVHNKNLEKKLLNQNEMTFTDENEHVKVTYIFTLIDGQQKSGTHRVWPVFSLFVKFK